MHRSFVLPATWRGWLVLAAFSLVIAAGIWPVVALDNRAQLVFGIPALMSWSYLILLGCCAAMGLGNWLIRGEIDDD